MSHDATQQAVAAQLRSALPGLDAEEAQRFAGSLLAPNPYRLGSLSLPQPGVPTGRLSAGRCPPGRVYPGVPHEYQVYVPAGSSQDLGLIVFLDGARYLGPEAQAHIVLDQLIEAGALPAMAAVFVEPGASGPGLPVFGGTDNRSLEYDSGGDAYARFLIEELLPEATAGLQITSDPSRRAVCGLSSGGHCAFNLAWQRPEAFGAVISHCGSFVNLRGGHERAFEVRRSPRKPLRVFLQTGRHDLDLVFGQWQLANRTLAAALAYRGYEHRLVVGEGGHSLAHGGALLPETLRWLFA